MPEKRITRSRSVDRQNIIASTGKTNRGGADAVIEGRNSSRRGERKRAKPKSEVVAYIGSGGEDTPMIDMLRAMKPVTQQFRTGDHIHVSDVISKCVRKIALMKRLGLRHPAEVVNDGRGVTFAIGDALHDYVKARFRDGEADKVWATWKCNCGGTSHTGTYGEIKGKLCPSCGGQVKHHHEVSIYDAEYDLVGNPDLEFWLDDYQAFFMTEIKSMAKDKWTELVRPMPEHVVQIVFYWYLKKRQGLPVLDRVSIIYVNKDFSFKSPYKEFCFEPNLKVLEPYLDDLKSLAEALAGGALPPRVYCRKMDSPDAKSCPVCATCFGLDE